MKRYTEKVIVVEGKYDKIRLDNIIDGTVITTEGFGLFNDPLKKHLIKELAEKRGIIVLTDSDSAGGVIRSHIATLTGKRGVINAYIPQVKGKEKRKSAPSADGFLGVEGTDDALLLDILEKAGAFNGARSVRHSLTKADLYRLGFYGVDKASEKRKSFLKAHSLPENLSPTAFLDAVNLLSLIEEQNFPFL